jgi:hypothetical protein
MLRGKTRGRAGIGERRAGTLGLGAAAALLPGPDRLEELPSMRDQIVQADLELVAVLEVLLQSAYSRPSFAAVVTYLVLHDHLAVLTPPAPIPVGIHR